VAGLRDLLLRAHDKALRNGSVRLSERPHSLAGEVLSINGQIFCLGPGSEKVHFRLRFVFRRFPGPRHQPHAVLTQMQAKQLVEHLWLILPSIAASAVSTLADYLVDGGRCLPG